jgi:cytochrome bd-type quinol oxidase subunit 2
MFFLILIGLVTLAGVAYLAVSPQSGLKLKITALGALALMITTVVICLFIFFKSAGIPKQMLLPDMDPSDLPPVSKEHNLPMMIMLVIFLIALFVMVAILSLREQKQGKENKNLPEDNFPDDWE